MYRTDDLTCSYKPETTERTKIVHATLNAHSKPPSKMRHKGYLHKRRHPVIWRTYETLIWEDENLRTREKEREGLIMITNGNGLFGGEYTCSPSVLMEVIPRRYRERVRVVFFVLFYFVFVAGPRRYGMCIQKYNAYVHVSFSTVFGILHHCLASWPKPDKLGAAMMFSLLLCAWVRVV